MLTTIITSYLIIGLAVCLFCHWQTTDPGFNQNILDQVNDPQAKEDIKKNGVSITVIVIGCLMAGLFWPVTLYQHLKNQ